MGLGAEVSGVTFALLPVRTASISGTAVDSQGRPMTGAFVTLMEVSENGEGSFMMSFGGGGGRVGENGHFTIHNVSPGESLGLRARDGVATPTPRPPRRRSSSAVKT